MPRPHPPEFRRRAVELARLGEHPVAKIAEDLGICDSCLRNWMRRADLDEGRRTDGLSSAEREVLVKLRRELKVARLEKEILERTAAYFAAENVLPKMIRATALGGTVAIRSASSLAAHMLDITGVRELVVLDASPTELSPTGPSDSPGGRATAAPTEDSAPVADLTGLAQSSTDVVDAALESLRRHRATAALFAQSRSPGTRLDHGTDRDREPQEQHTR